MYLWEILQIFDCKMYLTWTNILLFFPIQIWKLLDKKLKKDSIHKGMEKNFYTFFSRLEFTFYSFPCAFSSNFFISPLCIIRFEIGHIGPVLVLQQIFENALFKTWKTDMQRLSKNHVCRKCVFLSFFCFRIHFNIWYYFRRYENDI